MELSYTLAETPLNADTDRCLIDSELLNSTGAGFQLTSRRGRYVRNASGGVYDQHGTWSPWP